MTKIQIRRDASSNWQQYNPTPASGEPCYETDTGKFKIGNGEQPYNSLQYQGGGVEDILTAGVGIDISDDTLSIDQDTVLNPLLLYTNTDSSKGYIEGQYFHQLYNTPKVDAGVSTLTEGQYALVIAPNLDPADIHSFDFMTLVNFNNATFNGRDNRIIACGTDPNDSWIDTFDVDSVTDDPRGIIQFGGNTWGYDFSHLAIGQKLGFRIIHDGTTLYFYTKIHNTTDPLPTDLSQWRSWYSRAWDLNTYPLSKKSAANPGLAELTGLFQLGGSNFADGTTDVCQSGIYDLANTRLVINGEVVYGGEYLANPAQATSDKYGLVKIDNNTIKTTPTGEIYVDSSVIVPNNIVTTNTEQTVDGNKHFNLIGTDNLLDKNFSFYTLRFDGTNIRLGDNRELILQLNPGSNIQTLRGSTYGTVLDNSNLQDYVIAGENVTVTPDSTGKITIASTAGGSSEPPANMVTTDTE